MFLPLSFVLWAAPIFNRSVHLPRAACGPITSASNFNIMPLGASIVYGSSSSDGNGFRQFLRLSLLAQGAHVTMVGSQNSGNMPDNAVEAIPGYRIDQISGLADRSIPKQPNLVLIHAGTNDVIQNYQLGTADQRLGALVDKLLASIPGTAVLVSTLIPNRDPSVNTGLQTLNAKIRQVVANRASAGKKVYLVDMSAISINDINTSDGTHPTDGGYVKMAGIWFSGIQEVVSQCWFGSPAPSPTPAAAQLQTSSAPLALAVSTAPISSTSASPPPSDTPISTPTSATQASQEVISSRSPETQIPTSSSQASQTPVLTPFVDIPTSIHSSQGALTTGPSSSSFSSTKIVVSSTLSPFSSSNILASTPTPVSQIATSSAPAATTSKSSTGRNIRGTWTGGFVVCALAAGLVV